MLQVHLKTPVEITVNGQIEQSQFLNIPKPSRAIIHDSANLSQIGASVMVALASMNQNQSSEAKETPTDDGKDGFDADTALMLLKMSGKYKEAILAFDNFLLKHAFFDEQKVQSGSLNRMDLKDYNNALGEYFGKYCFLDSTQA
jgi:hypothetical protein